MENRISIPKGGLKKSIDPRNLSSNDITHALNTTLFDTDGDFYDISYEKSNILATKFPDGYVIIGRVNRLKNNYTYYFLTNPLTGNSLFGYVDNSANYDDSITEDNLEELNQTPYKTFNILIDDSCAVDKLKLSELHPIQNIVLKEEKTGAVIYFTDFINPSRHIEIDNIQKYFTEEVPCDDDINTSCPDVSKMRIHKLYLLPKIDDVMVSSGGSLERGTYSFLIALSDAMGNEVSEYTSITQPISIWDNTNETTDKAIRLIVNDLDPDYTHYKVVVLFNQHLDNAQSTRLVGVFPNTNKEVIVSNIGNLERISYETVTYVNVRVTNSENLTSFNNQLAEYGLVYERELNLQPVVNMIGSYLKWQTHVAKEDLYSYPEMQYKYTGINRNEVVPYSLRFLKKGGSTTALFPLVGREANAIDLQEINNLDVESLETGISCGDNLRTQRWKLYNTATVEEGCGTPEDFIEVEELYTWTCTDNDTARTGAGEIVIEDVNFELTDLESYYQDYGCFANLCQILEQDLHSQVECNNSPCNNNPQLIDSVNFISEEINVRIEDVYSSEGKFGEFARTPSDDIYIYAKDLGTILTGVTENYIIGSFEQRINTWHTVWSSAPLIPTISVKAQLLSYDGYVNPVFSVPTTIPPAGVDVIRGQVLYRKPRYYGTGGAVQYFHINRGNINEPKFLRFLLNSKFEDPIPNEYINQEDFRVLIAVDDYKVDSVNPDLRSQQHYQRSIVFDGFLSDYKDKNLVIEPISDDVEDGLRILVLGQGGNVEASYSSTNIHYSRNIWVYVGTGSIYSEDDKKEIFLSPRFSYQPYFEKAELSGKKILWDDIVIGTTVNYKDICTTLEPVVKACEAVPWQKGGFSYWESGLQYPDNPELYDSSKLEINVNDIPQQYRAEFQQLFTNGVSAGQYQIKDSFNLTCKPIRHFKFPDNKVAPFIQNTTLTPFSETYIYPLGVTIDENIINMFLDIAVKNNLLTQEERDEIYSYELFRGDLSTNRSVVASGLLYDTRQYTEKEKTVEYLNYPYNSYSADHLNPDSIIKEGFGQRGSNFGFHSPETDYYSPTIPTELNIQGYQFGFSKGYFDEVEGHPKMVVLSPEAYNLAGTLATLEVTAEALLAMTQAMANVDAGWQIIQGGIGSTGGGTNWGGYAIQMGIAGGIGVIMAIEAVVYNYARYKLQWQETFKNLGQQRNFAHYYFSEGNYNYLRTDQTEGHIVRGIHFGKKIKDSRYTITDTVDRDKVELNNIDREYTTFLKLGDDYAINYPSSYSGYDRESITFSSNEGENNEGKSDQIQKKIASPYAQLVNSDPTLHGQIDSVTWLYTGYRGDLEYPQSGCLPVFGGDTYITRHTFKRKIPLFLTTAMGQSNMTPFDYKVTNNIGKTPRFYISYDATSEFRQSGRLFPEVVNDYQFDNQTQRGKYIVPPSKFYLYYYGVPSFLTETRVNTHYREFGREPGDNFYPNVGDLGWWTQERNVSIRTPNYYKYSKTYSNQVNVFNHRSLRQTYKQNHQNILDRSVNGVIFSLPDNNENGQIDPWLKFRPLDTFEFETKYGELKELKGIENESILARFEHTAIIYNKVQTTVDDGTSPTVRLGGKDIFQRRTASFVNSELGFGGTQQAESLSCEYGHFYTDTKRGQVIQIPSGGGNMIEISNNNSKGEMTFMRDWFKRNLPFKILNSNIDGIQELDVDNNYNGVGISLGYDSQHRRILITKKDYLPLDPCIEYSRELGFYTTCGTNVEYSCPPGYTFNPDNLTCEREVVSDVCPPGYQYDSVNNVCFRSCDIRLAFILDNIGSASLNSAIDYVSAILSSLNYDAQVSFYNLYGNSLTIIEDLNVQQAINFLGSYVGQTSSDYKFAEVTCIAGAWLNQDESVERVMNFYNMDTTEPDPNDYVCGDSQTTGIYSMSDYYKNTGVTIIGTGDYQGTADILDFFTEDMFFTSSTITQEILDFYQSLSCEGGSEVPTICNCEIEDEQCVCIQTVPPIVSDTEKVFVCDETKFKDVGWTVSYDPSSGMFHSFMDYKPNFYTSMQGYFEAGKSCLGASTWAHGITNRSYGVFFGNKFPMEVETITKGSLREYIGNVELLTEAKRYQSELDFTINPDITFNKSVIYNRRECSGQMVLDLVKGSLAQYPITTTDYQRIPITKTESTFNYNYFFDRVDRINMSPFIINDENQIKIALDNINFRQRAPLPRINGDWFYNRLTYDTDTKLNLTLKLQKSLTNLDKL